MIRGFVKGVPGPRSEARQQLSFVTSTDQPDLFENLPAVDEYGNLTFQARKGVSGVASVAVAASDSGGTALGGQDSAPPAQFSISLTAPAK